MPKTLNSLEAWGFGQNKKNRMLASARWEYQHKPASLVPSPAKSNVTEPTESAKAVKVIRVSGFEVHRSLLYLVADWFTDEQRAQLERAAFSEVEKSTSTAPAVAMCKLTGYDGDEAVCAMSVSGYEVPRVGLPRKVLDAKRVEVGDKFHWIMRDAANISPDDIDTNVSSAEPRLTNDEQKRLNDLYEEIKRERALDDGSWEEYTGPGQ